MILLLPFFSLKYFQTFESAKIVYLAIFKEKRSLRSKSVTRPVIFIQKLKMR